MKGNVYDIIYVFRYKKQKDNVDVKEKNYGKQTGFYCKGSREVGIH